ncbi:MAG TPA: hypothetical protein VJJ52_02935 [Candidatus Nanoarchaeia archaeon]|nr:hypothetical protein [Candidatus Nanoarchaeia archaeon]
MIAELQEVRYIANSHTKQAFVYATFLHDGIRKQYTGNGSTIDEAIAAVAGQVFGTSPTPLPTNHKISTLSGEATRNITAFGSGSHIKGMWSGGDTIEAYIIASLDYTNRAIAHTNQVEGQNELHEADSSLGQSIIKSTAPLEELAAQGSGGHHEPEDKDHHTTGWGHGV